MDITLENIVSPLELKVKKEGDKKYKLSVYEYFRWQPDLLSAYLSKAYFNQLNEILSYSKKKGRKAIFYYEVGYPSGITNYATPEKYYRKLLVKNGEIVIGSKIYDQNIPSQGKILAVVAINTNKLERLDITSKVKNNILKWSMPAGQWKVMVFNCIIKTNIL